jgi:hypothetical protein
MPCLAFFVSHFSGWGPIFMEAARCQTPMPQTVSSGKTITAAADEKRVAADSHDVFMITAVSAKTQARAISRLACGRRREIVSKLRITC